MLYPLSYEGWPAAILAPGRLVHRQRADSNSQRHRRRWSTT